MFIGEPGGSVSFVMIMNLNECILTTTSHSSNYSYSIGILSNNSFKYFYLA